MASARNLYPAFRLLAITTGVKDEKFAMEIDRKYN
jgi:hypothetical protein